MAGRQGSPLDAPQAFQATVEEFKRLTKELGCDFVYQPTHQDNPPDTVIVTNKEILQEQATTQQILETLLSLQSFSWKQGKLYYSTGGAGGQGGEVEADSFIEAIYQILMPEKADA